MRHVGTRPWVAGSNSGLLTKDSLLLQSQWIQTDNVLAGCDVKNEEDVANCKLRTSRQPGWNPACKVVLEASRVKTNARAKASPHD